MTVTDEREDSDYGKKRKKSYFFSSLIKNTCTFYTASISERQ